MRPERLKLMGKVWSISYEKLSADDIGESDLETQHIKIKDGLKPEQEKSTLLHEVLHAISDTIGAGLSEKQVQGLETGLWDVLKHNPKFVTYLRRKG